MVLRRDKCLADADHEPAKDVVVNRSQPVRPKQALETGRPDSTGSGFVSGDGFIFGERSLLWDTFEESVIKVFFRWKFCMAKYEDN